MDVSGQDMTWVPSKGKAPQRVRVKRSIGQEKKPKTQKPKKPLNISLPQSFNLSLFNTDAIVRKT